MSATQLNVLIAAAQLLFAALVFFRVDIAIFHRKPKRGLAKVSATPKLGMTRNRLILILIAGGFAFCGYAFYRTLGNPLDNQIIPARAERKRTAEALASHLQDGLGILHQYSKPPFPKQTALNDWEENVHRLLRSPPFGEPYVARFDSASGFEGVYPVELPAEDVKRYIWLEQRIGALREFIKEFSTQ